VICIAFVMYSLCKSKHFIYQFQLFIFGQVFCCLPVTEIKRHIKIFNEVKWHVQQSVVKQTADTLDTVLQSLPDACLKLSGFGTLGRAEIIAVLLESFVFHNESKGFPFDWLEVSGKHFSNLSIYLPLSQWGYATCCTPWRDACLVLCIVPVVL